MLNQLGFGDVLQLVYANVWVRAIVGLMLADVMTGIGLSLYYREFRLGATADFLFTRAIPYLLGAGTVQVILLTVPTELRGAITTGAGGAVWAAALAAMLGHVLDNLRQLGLPVPVSLTAKHATETKVTL
jgi:hypothetical protein